MTELKRQYTHRWHTESVAELRKQRRVILLEGARQTGKTTLARNLSDSTTDYRTLDDINVRESAKRDPRGFLVQRARCTIIDEVQQVPELLSEIKRLVDIDTRPGQFLLTGSARLHDLPQVNESLAGRVAGLRLRTLSQGEIAGSSPDFFERAQAGDFAAVPQTFNKISLLECAMAGGYAEALTLNHRARRSWHRDYVNAIVNRDLHDLADIRKLDVMSALLQVAAAWSGKLVDITQIGRELGINRATVENYLAALRMVFLVDRLSPWTHTDYARVGKKDRLFISDSGLMASLLRLPHDVNRLSDDQTGKLMECFIYTELMSLLEQGEGRYAIYHYRDNEQREIDFLIDDEEYGFIGIEVKAGLTVRAGDFRHLHWFNKNMCKSRPMVGIIMYSGSEVLPFGQNMWAIPSASLWHS